MSFVKDLFLYIFNVLSSAPRFRVYTALMRHLKRFLDEYIKRHPITVIATAAAAALIAIIIIYHPKPYCSYIDADSQSFAKGDSLSFGAERPCKARKLIAFEVMSRDDVDFWWKKKKISDLVSADLFVKASVIGEGDELKHWRNFSLFVARGAGGNDMTLNESAEDQEFTAAFVKGSCAYDQHKMYTPFETENRKGIELKGASPFAGRGLGPELRRSCNFRSPEDPKNADCDWSYLHLFIPSIEPVALCKQRAWWERWISPGVQRYDLADKRSLGLLREYARYRFDPEAAQPISDNDWVKSVMGLPKFCGRRLGLKEEYIPNDSLWQEEGSVVSVWCDN